MGDSEMTRDSLESMRHQAPLNLLTAVETELPPSESLHQSWRTTAKVTLKTEDQLPILTHISCQPSSSILVYLRNQKLISCPSTILTGLNGSNRLPLKLPEHNKPIYTDQIQFSI